MFYKNLTKHKKSFFSAVVLITAALFFGVSTADAATIYLRPSTNSLSVGNIVSVKVFVNTDGKSVNNAEGTIQFPTDLFEVISVTKSGSIFSLWVEEPTFSNYNGTISFNGGVPNPGFVGSAGEVAAITFKAKKPGSASVIFGATSVRENDGLGTDILSSKISTTIKIEDVAQVKPQPTETTPTPAVTPTPKNSVPDKPLVVSTTQPKQDVWYKNNAASFSWKVPAGVTSVQASLNKNQLTVPTVTYDGSVSQKTLNDVADGLYYFNLRQKNDAGWSPVAHFKVQIDATAPNEFTPTVRIDNYRNIISFGASDDTSGIDHYLVTLDSSDAVKIDAKSLVAGEYALPVLPEGSHTMSVAAYDKAGNKRDSKVSFTSPEVVPAEVSLSRDVIESGEGVDVTGTTLYPNIELEIVLESEKDGQKKYNTVADANGNFKLNIEDIKTVGTVRVWANIVLGQSKFSKPSKVAELEVGELKSVQNIKRVLYPISGIVAAGLLILLFSFLLYLGWHRFFGLKRKISGDLSKTAKSIHKTLGEFRNELDNQLAALERLTEDRELSRKERKIFNEIKKNIDNIDDFVEKKIKELL